MQMSCKSVFVIDDDEDIRETLTLALEAEGYKVFLASDGSEALDMLQTLPDADLPGIIFLDIQMPVMDGMQVLNHFKTHPEAPYSRIPVVVATAKGSGANFPDLPVCVERVRKPMDLDELYSIVEKHCGKPAN